MRDTTFCGTHEALGSIESWWKSEQPSSYQKLDLPIKSQPNDELARLLAARTGHGDFADYHEHYCHEDARLLCSCGRRKSPDHLFYYRKVKACHRVRLTPSADRAIAAAVSKDFGTFLKVVEVTNFYKDICA